MAFRALPGFDQKLLTYGVGGYAIVAMAYSVVAPKEAPVAAPAPAPAAAPAAAAAVASAANSVSSMPAAAASAGLESGELIKVLFAVEDIQKRLMLIEKILKQ